MKMNLRTSKNNFSNYPAKNQYGLTYAHVMKYRGIFSNDISRYEPNANFFVL